MGDETLDIGQTIAREHGRALSCHERSLFFATKLPRDFQIWGFPALDLNVSSLEPSARRALTLLERLSLGLVNIANRLSKSNFVDLEEFNQQEAERQIRLKEALIKQKELPHNNLVLFYSYIHSIYFQSYEILIDRLADVTEKYQPIRKKLQKKGIGGDRDIGAIIASKERVMRRHKDLLRSADPLDTDAPNADGKRSFEEYCRIWEGLEHICRLYMDEITYLGGRINDFNNIKLGRKSLRLAYIGVIVSMILTFLSVVISNSKEIVWDAVDSNTPGRKTVKLLFPIWQEVENLAGSVSNFLGRVKKEWTDNLMNPCSSEKHK